MNRPYPDKILENSYIAVKKCKHGYLMYNTNDMYIGRSLDVYGEWCENELDLLSNYIKRGDTIVDVGANIGTHTLFFANSVGETGTVYALEPQRIQQQILCANLVLNGIQNVYTDQLAAGDKFEQALVPVLNPEIDHNFGGVDIRGWDSGDPVPVIPLDSLNLTACHLIKIDVEGMEKRVLLGTEKTILKLRPVLFLESNRIESTPDVLKLLVNRFEYDCWWFIDHLYNPSNFFGNPENIFPNIHPDASLLCLPKELNSSVSNLIRTDGTDDNWKKARGRMINSNES